MTAAPSDPNHDCSFEEQQWSDWPGIDGAVLICDTHGLPADGDVYDRGFGYCQGSRDTERATFDIATITPTREAREAARDRAIVTAPATSPPHLPSVGPTLSVDAEAHRPPRAGRNAATRHGSGTSKQCSTRAS